MPKSTPISRFRAKVTISAERSYDGTPCWQWEGGRNTGGYGHFYSGTRAVAAHIWSYEHHVRPVSAGLCLDHLCRNRLCVNPLHLEEVTWPVNILRGEGAGARNARKTHCVNGHEFTPENTTLHLKGRVCRTCMRAARLRHREARLALDHARYQRLKAEYEAAGSPGPIKEWLKTIVGRPRRVRSR